MLNNALDEIFCVTEVMYMSELTRDSSAIKWLASALEEHEKGSFDESVSCEVLWEEITYLEKYLDCDPVRGVRLEFDKEKDYDLIVFSYSYFSIAYQGVFHALTQRAGVVALAGQEEDIEEKHILPAWGENGILSGPFSEFVRRICEYSIEFDTEFRKSLVKE